MTDPLEQFRINIGYATDLSGLATAIDSQTTGALDASDIKRAALVSAVSSMDYYVHEIVRVLMIEIASGLRVPTNAFNRFQTSAAVLTRAVAGESAERWMDEEVRRSHGHLSFQHPDKIADGIRLVWSGELWRSVAKFLGSDAASVKLALKLVVDRRNCIVHEADRNPTPPSDRWTISDDDVHHAVGTIVEIVEAIDGVLRAQ